MGTDVSPARVTADPSPAPWREERTHYRWLLCPWSSLRGPRFRPCVPIPRKIRRQRWSKEPWDRKQLKRPQTLKQKQWCKNVRDWSKGERDVNTVCEFVFVGVLELISLFVLYVCVWAFLYLCMTVCVGIWDTVCTISSPETASTDSEAADTDRPGRCTTNGGNNKTH